MKAIKSILVLMMMSLILSNCSNDTDDEPQPTPNDPEDGQLTDEQLSYLEAAKDTVVGLEDVILENGQSVKAFLDENDPEFLREYPSGRKRETKELTPQRQKLTFISRMIGMANYLVTDSYHTYESEGPDKPAQNGLAYSWGSKEYKVRQIPPGVTGQCKDKKIYGLDCSGLLWTVTQAANLEVVPKYNFFVEYITDAKKWTKAFQASTDYKDLEMKDMGQLPKDKIKNGDIILWKQHVGIYLFGAFYQSNGRSGAPGCNDNLKPDRGPRLVSLANILSWGLGSYKVFRAIYGADYELTIREEYSQMSLSSPFCRLGNYIDSTVINITITAKDEVILNSIKNRNPAFNYSSVGCSCLSSTFPNGSVVEYTYFFATYNTSIVPSEPNNILVYDMKYTWCSPTDRYECEDVVSTISGQIIPGNTIGGNIDLPTEEDQSVIYPWDNNGTLTVTHLK